MKEILSPHAVSEQLMFPPLPFDQVNGNIGTMADSVLGQISQDGLWSWVVKDAVLDVFRTTKEERCATWNFATITNDPTLYILSVSEFVTRKDQSPALVTVLRNSSESSIMCLLEIKTSKITKIIEIPGKVSSVEVVTTQGGASMETRCLCQELRYMFGIVAVGLQNGCVLFIDMCIDEKMDAMDFACSQTIFITTKTHNIAGRRENAILHCQHLCLPLNDDACHHGLFSYRSEDGNLIGTISSNDVYVSAMKYLPHLCMLAVGFNFGGFQLWNLQTMVLEHTCIREEGFLPVIQFAFQEPENDPRNFCYLWVGRGQTDLESDRAEYLSVASLYSLAFEKKEWLNNMGFIYQLLTSVIRKFEFPLVSDPFRSDTRGITSRLVTCYSIQQGEASGMERSEQDSLHGEDWNSQDLSLCILAWETWSGHQNEPNAFCLALFDINQWYQARMPYSLSETRLSPYIGIFSLSDVARRVPTEPILDIHLNSRSLVKFQSLSLSAEQFYYPSSLSFSIRCLSESGVITASFLGIQRLVLSKMISFGPECLIEPKEVFNMCHIAGLFTSCASESNSISVTSSTLSLRESLLTLALEYDMIPFLMTCVNEWSSGGYNHVGCTVKLLLEWSWKRVCHIRNSIDKLCISLFNCSGQELDQNSLRILHSYESQLNHLGRILSMLDSHGGPLTKQGHRELGMRKEAVKLISTYLRVILWLYDCRLLPEHLEGEAYGEDEVAYPASVFATTYEQRRQELVRLHSSIQKTDILLVDGMMSSAVGAQWEKLGGNGLYPPPSLLALISIYLLDSVSMEDKHRLMLYFLLDMAAFLSDRQSHLVERIMRFSAAFNLSPNLVKLTQGFWLLDHKDFQEATSMLLDPMIKPSDILPWQYTRILKALLYQGEHEKALKFCRVRGPLVQNADDIKVHLSVLLANRLISEAFYYLKHNVEDNNMEDLLNHFFLGCEQTHSLNTLLQLPFSKTEEDALIQFLQSSPLPQAKEIIVAYLLQRNRPLDAAKMNEKLKPHQGIVTGSKGHQTQSRDGIRQSMVQGFLRILPEAQGKLVNLAGPKTYPEVAEARPSPISCIIHTSSLPLVSQSTRLRMIMDHIESLSNGPVPPASPFPNRMKASSSKCWTAEDYPFLRTPATPKSVKKRDINEVIYPSPLHKDTLHAHEDEQEELVSPAKRMKYLDTTSFKTFDTAKRWNSSKLFNAEIQSVLQSTPVRRQKSTAFDQQQHQKSAIPMAHHITPQSILKVRQMLRRSASPPLPSFSDNLRRSRQASESSMNKEENGAEDEVMMETSVIDEDNVAKQLRFEDLETSGSSPENKSPSQLSLTRPELHQDETTPRSIPSILQASDDVVIEDEDITLNLRRQKEGISVCQNEASEDEDITEEECKIEEQISLSPVRLYPSLKEAASIGEVTPPLESIADEDDVEEKEEPISDDSGHCEVAPPALSPPPESEVATDELEKQLILVAEEEEKRKKADISAESESTSIFEEGASVVIESEDDGLKEITEQQVPDDMEEPETPEVHETLDKPELVGMSPPNLPPPALETSTDAAKDNEELMESSSSVVELVCAEDAVVSLKEVSTISEPLVQAADEEAKEPEMRMEEESSPAEEAEQPIEPEKIESKPIAKTDAEDVEVKEEKQPVETIVPVIVEKEATPERMSSSEQDMVAADEDSVSIPEVSRTPVPEPQSSPYLGTRSRTRNRSTTPEGKQGSETSSRTSSPASTTKPPSSRTSSPATPRISPRILNKEKEPSPKTRSAKSSPVKKQAEPKPTKKAPEAEKEAEKPMTVTPKSSESKKGSAKKAASAVLKKSIKKAISQTSSSSESRSASKVAAHQRRYAQIQKKSEEMPKFTFSQPIISEGASDIVAESTETLPSPSFIFSPPVTRSKTRRKKSEDTTRDVESEKGSKFVDPLLASPSQADQPSTSKTPSTRGLSTRSEKMTLRDKKKSKVAKTVDSEKTLRLISPVSFKTSPKSSDAASAGTSQQGASTRPPRHRMALRKTRFQAQKKKKL